MLTEHFTRPSLEEMARRLFKAKKLLEKFCLEHSVSAADMAGRDTSEPLRGLRYKYIWICRAENIGPATVARLLKRNVTTIGYHMGHAKGRKTRYQRARRAKEDAKRARDQGLAGDQGPGARP